MSDDYLEIKCVCLHAYGEHISSLPHRCTECVCDHFRRPLSKSEPPDFFYFTGEPPTANGTQTDATTEYERALRSIPFELSTLTLPDYDLYK